MQRSGLLLTLVAILAAGPGCHFDPVPRDRILHDENYPLRLGVHPFLQPRSLHRAFTPLTRLLEARLKRGIDLIVANSLEHLHELARQGLVDLAWTRVPGDPPPGAPAFEILCWPVPAHAEDYRLALVTPHASPPKDLAALKGGRLSLADRRSWNGASELAAFMVSKGMPPVTSFSTIDAVGNHEDVLRRAREGRCDLAAVLHLVLTKRPRAGKKPRPPEVPVDVIAVTEPLAIEPISVSSDLPAPLKAELGKILLSLAGDPAGEAALKALRAQLGLEGFAAR